MAEDGWTELSVPVGDATLAAQWCGRRDDPVLLLLGGATWSRDWWEDGLCAELARLELRVVRFDPRDTGASTSYPPGDPGYGAIDLGNDVLAVLDAVTADPALLMGLSMGGGMAQELAAFHPERVAGLILLSTSSRWPTGRSLPPPDVEAMATAGQVPDPDWDDEDSYVAWVQASERPYAGPERFDPDRVAQIARRAWRRSGRPASAANHNLVLDGGADELPPPPRLPAAVLHGTADPLFPLPHGQALAEVLGASFTPLPGVGHQAPPPEVWPLVVAAVADVRARSALGG